MMSESAHLTSLIEDQEMELQNSHSPFFQFLSHYCALMITQK